MENIFFKILKLTDSVEDFRIVMSYEISKINYWRLVQDHSRKMYFWYALKC